MTYSISYLAMFALMYLEISPKFYTDTCWRKLAIFALLIFIVAKG